MESKNLENDYSLATACLLLLKGANLAAINNKGKTPLDFLTEPTSIDVLQAYSLQAR